MGSGSVGPFCQLGFLSCRIVRSLMIALTCLRVFLDGSFFMDLVSSKVALWILSAWVIVGFWTIWWLNWTVWSVLSAPFFFRHYFVASIMFHGGADIPFIEGMEIPGFSCLRFVVYHCFCARWHHMCSVEVELPM